VTNAIRPPILIHGIFVRKRIKFIFSKLNQTSGRRTMFKPNNKCIHHSLNMDAVAFDIALTKNKAKPSLLSGETSVIKLVQTSSVPPSSDPWLME
jgi:hypothetical protein